MPVITDLRMHVHILTNRLQAILGYLELEDYKAALVAARAAVKDVRSLAQAIAGQVLAMPKQDAVVIVPPGTKVLESQKVNVIERATETKIELPDNVVAIVKKEDIEEK